MNKVESIYLTCEEEFKEYEALDADINKSIGQVTSENERLKVQLSEERMLRRYKEEYENIARVVNALPSRSELSSEIEKEKKILDASQRGLDQATARLETRSKQFDLLIRTIHDLQKTLQEDVQNDEQQLLMTQEIESSSSKPQEEV